MIYCRKCLEDKLKDLKPLRSDNKYGFCRKHRFLSEELILKRKQYSDNNKEKRKLNYQNRTEEERQEFREVNRIASKKYRDNNKEKRNKTCISWIKRNPEKARVIAQRAEKKRRGTIKGSIDHRLSTGIYQALRHNKAGRHWESLVDYTLDDLKNHLEKLFTPEMTWDKFLNGEIHIDHVKARSKFNYTSSDDPEFKECWGLANLQPLWALDNIKKSNK